MPFNRVASEESQVLASQFSSPVGQWSPLILYRLSSADERSPSHISNRAFLNRNSIISTSGESAFSLSSDSKYPFGAFKHGALIPYVYHPGLDCNHEPEDGFPDNSDDPQASDVQPNLRAFLNVGSLILLILGLLILFIFYPVFTYLSDRDFSAAITGNYLVNSTGQVPASVT